MFKLTMTIVNTTNKLLPSNVMILCFICMSVITDAQSEVFMASAPNHFLLPGKGTTMQCTVAALSGFSVGIKLQHVHQTEKINCSGIIIGWW